MGLSQTFLLSPSTTPNDIGAQQLILVNDLGAAQSFAAQLFIGEVVNGKAWDNYGGYFRFEPNMPDDAVIEAVLFEALFFGSSGSSAQNVQGGFIVRDGTWDDADGFWGYANRTAFPKPYADNGSVLTPALWWGSSAAWDASENIDINGIQTADTVLSIGEGIASTYPVTGFTSKLQTYWADAGNRAARGTAVTADGIPLAFHLHSTDIAAVGVISLKSGSGDIPHAPTLTIVWHSPNGEGSATLSSTSTLTADGAVVHGLKATLSSTSTLTADGAVVHGLKATLSSTSTLTADLTLVLASGLGIVVEAARDDALELAARTTVPTISARSSVECLTGRTTTAASAAREATAITVSRDDDVAAGRDEATAAAGRESPQVAADRETTAEPTARADGTIETTRTTVPVVASRETTTATVARTTDPVDLIDDRQEG